MRINVYNEEITTEVELVRRIADTGAYFYGLRFFLTSPTVLHRSPDDDDRSAVTFWAASLDQLHDILVAAEDALLTYERESL